MRAPLLCALACLLGGSCSSEPLPADAGADPAPDLASPPPDLATPPAQGDSLPKGAVSFFNRKSCPSGWAPFALSAGRTLVGALEGEAPGSSVGDPLDDTEDRKHGHAVKTTWTPGSVSYAGIAGEANHGVARATAAPITGQASAAAAGLPYVQLLVCHKQADPDPAQRPAPVGALQFFSGERCPAGWGPSGLAQGRLLVGLPDRGTPGQKFGGKPLAAGERRAHRHEIRGVIQTRSHGIALVSGGAAGGYAENGRYNYQVNSEEELVPMPYLQLLQCQKQ